MKKGEKSCLVITVTTVTTITIATLTITKDHFFTKVDRRTNRQTDGRTTRGIELLWAAKKSYTVWLKIQFAAVSVFLCDNF